MSILDEVETIPRALLDAVIIIPLMISFNFLADGPYWWKENIIVLIMLYSVNWFAFRIILTPFGFYGGIELLQPVRLFALSCFLWWGVVHFYPDYKWSGDQDVSTEDMASDCPQAKWTVHIQYAYNKGYLHGSDSYHVVGNTETAKIKAQENVDSFFRINPTYQYESHSLILYHLPRKFCQEKRYSLKWSECPDPDKTSEHQRPQ